MELRTSSGNERIFFRATYNQRPDPIYTLFIKEADMATKKSMSNVNNPTPNLIIARSEAQEKLKNRVTAGKELLELNISSENDLESGATGVRS